MRLSGCVVALYLLIASSANAGMLASDPSTVFTSSPNDSWSYYEYVHQPAGVPLYSTDYFPASVNDFAGASFVSFVRPDPFYSSEVGGETWYGDGENTFQIFTAYLKSDVDQTIQFGIGGDDGHSLFINDALIGGTGFGGYISHDLVLQAGISQKVTMAGYNGPYRWSFTIGLRPIQPLINPQFSGLLESTPGLSISAVPFDSVAPEPSSMALISFGCVGLLAARRKSNFKAC